MMTRAQKQAILERRAEGIPYQAIADEMGMSLGSVKMFVSRYRRKYGTLDSVGEADSLSIEGQEPDSTPAENESVNERLCLQCHKALPLGTRKSQLFCSRECRNVWWNGKRKNDGQRIN